MQATGAELTASQGPLPPLALAAGFQDGTLCPHTSRTLMLSELRMLLDAVPAQARRADYRITVVDDNVLLKPTTRTRKKTFELLGQLYGLDPSITLFRAMRDLWAEAGQSGQPLLAVLCALARDPSFRATLPVILGATEGSVVVPEQLMEAVVRRYPDRFNPTTLQALGQHAASSWQQSGHLQGHVRKLRVHAAATPGATTYALLLGHLAGKRGEALFRTCWAAALDAPEYVLREHAAAASRRGWLEYRAAGEVTEITFHHLMRPPEAAGGTDR
jgi:hypothetical protein